MNKDFLFTVVLGLVSVATVVAKFFERKTPLNAVILAIVALVIVGFIFYREVIILKSRNLGAEIRRPWCCFLFGFNIPTMIIALSNLFGK